MTAKSSITRAASTALSLLAIAITAAPCLSSEVGLSENDRQWWNPEKPGLVLTATGGGESSLKEVEVGGRRAWKPARPNSYFHFAVDDSLLHNVSTDVSLTVAYYDSRDSNFRIEYDSADTSLPLRGAYKDTPFLRGRGTNRWLEHTFRLKNARFANRENNNSDFRILAYGTDDVSISRVTIRWDDSVPVRQFSRAQNRNVKVWMGPLLTGGGLQDIASLFERPDEWQQTRSMVTGFLLSDLHLDRFSDAQFGAWLPQVRKWGTRMGLEVGAIKEWATTGDVGFRLGKQKWDRFLSLGGRIDRFGMDEPLYCSRFVLKKPFSYAVDETAKFVASVRKEYPEATIGDIEPYPGFSVKHLTAWVDALNRKLNGMGVRGLDFLVIDADWSTFGGKTGGSWTDLKKLEDACRARKLPFSLCYWSANYGQVRMMDLEDDATWYMSIMRQGYDYALAGGSPDEYVIESWTGLPPRVLPETENYTFTNSVRDFVNRFVR